MDEIVEKMRFYVGARHFETREEAAEFLKTERLRQKLLEFRVTNDTEDEDGEVVMGHPFVARFLRGDTAPELNNEGRVVLRCARELYALLRDHFEPVEDPASDAAEVAAHPLANLHVDEHGFVREPDGSLAGVLEPIPAGYYWSVPSGAFWRVDEWASSDGAATAGGALSYPAGIEFNQKWEARKDEFPQSYEECRASSAL